MLLDKGVFPKEMVDTLQRLGVESPSLRHPCSPPLSSCLSPKFVPSGKRFAEIARPKVVQVFVASSSDIRDERERVRRVMERLHITEGDDVWLRPLMGEDYDTPAGQPPQAAVFKQHPL